MSRVTSTASRGPARNALLIAWSISTLLIGPVRAAAAADENLNGFKSTVPFKPFEKSDGIAFLGDSITASGKYVSLIRLFYATRFPDRPLRIYNCGIGGARAPTSWSRLEPDCLDLDPTWVIVMLGMNDAGRSATPSSVKQYQQNMSRIMDRVAEEPGRKLALIVSSPYDQTAKVDTANQPGKNDTIRKYGSWLEAQGSERRVPVIDFNTPILEINGQHQRIDPAFSAVGADRIHPGIRGHTVMLHTFLHAQGIKGPVARVEIDAAKAVAKADGATVGDLQVTSEQLSFVYTPDALPFPAEAVPFASPDEEWVPFTEDLNREWIVVRGLQEGRWALSADNADNKDIGEFTAGALAQGIDLARETNGPSYQHAHRILALAEQVDQAEQNLRAAARVRWLVLEPQGIELDDAERASAALREYMARHPDHAYSQSRGEIFLRLNLASPEKRRAERERMESLIDRLYQINKPEAHRLVLRLIKPEPPALGKDMRD